MKKHEAAAMLGRLGGKARAKALTASQRSAIAKKAGKARLKKLTKAERRRIALKAIRARWAKKGREQ